MKELISQIDPNPPSMFEKNKNAADRSWSNKKI
jgi:hypothetical protein